MKFLKYLLYALLILSAICMIAFYASGYSDGMAEASLNWSIVLFVVAVLCTLVMPFFFSSGKGRKGTFVRLGIAVVLCVVSYLLANTALEVSINVETTETALKWTDAGLKLSCILIVGVILAIISGFFINTIRKN